MEFKQLVELFLHCKYMTYLPVVSSMVQGNNGTIRLYVCLKAATGRPRVSAFLPAIGRRRHTYRSIFCGLCGALEQSLHLRSTRSAWTQAYSLSCYQRLNTGVEHALLEQLTFFSNASIILEDVDTHRSTLLQCVKAQTKCRQSHVNAGRQGRHVAGSTWINSPQINALCHCFLGRNVEIAFLIFT